MKSDTVRLSIDISKELHKALKFYVINHDTTIKDFFLDLLEKHMPEEIEDYVLGKMALEAEKEGSLGVEETEKFLKGLRKKADSLKKSK